MYVVKLIAGVEGGVHLIVNYICTTFYTVIMCFTRNIKLYWEVNGIG